MLEFMRSESGTVSFSQGVSLGWMVVAALAALVVFGTVDEASALVCSGCDIPPGGCKIVNCYIDTSKCPTYAHYVQDKVCVPGGGGPCTPCGYTCNTSCIQLCSNCP